jgi:hypothetical protein
MKYFMMMIIGLVESAPTEYIIPSNTGTIIVGVIAALGVAWGAWLQFYQYAYNKKQDLKLEGIKIDNDRQMATNNRHIASIHGIMWELLHKLNADRCFIIQPHPERNHRYLSVVFEVDRPGVSAVKEFFQNIPMSDMTPFAKDMSSNVWLYYDDVDRQVGDKKAQSMMFLAGTVQLALRQLVDVKSEWIGTLVVENIDVKEYDKDKAMEIIGTAATSTQYILPPIY